MIKLYMKMKDGSRNDTHGREWNPPRSFWVYFLFVKDFPMYYKDIRERMTVLQNVRSLHDAVSSFLRCAATPFHSTGFANRRSIC